MRKSSLSGLAVWLTAGMACAEGTLGLADYLGQVKAKGPDYQAAQAAVEGYEKQSHQQDLTYSPQLTASYNHMDDQSQQSTILAAQQTMTDSAGVSLSDKLPFGPSVSVGYAFNDISIVYPQSLLTAFNAFGPGSFLSSYYQVSPVVSLSVPLFKDFGGAQTAAGVKMVQYQLESAAQNSAFQREQVLFNARVAYWNLALARESIVIRQDSLDRSQKIWDWTKRRVARNLADPPDALQAEASVRLAELDLQTAQENEKTARLSFNRLRNQPDDQVTESLETLEDSLAQTRVDIPGNLPDRLDLKAVEKSADQQKATFDEAYQNIYPDLTAMASWRGNGLDPSFPNANDIAFGSNHPTWSLGAQFTLSLDVFTAQRTADGYQKNYESALQNLEDKRLEVAKEWKDLQNHISDVQKRLDMATEIEGIQKNKADQERQRLEYGRTTEFQLLSFENDYSLARLNKLSLVLEKLSYLAQAQWWLAGENEKKE